jgi:hypothetical protein
MRRRYMSYEEEDTCHMRRRIHVICNTQMDLLPVRPNHRPALSRVREREEERRRDRRVGWERECERVHI